MKYSTLLSLSLLSISCYISVGYLINKNKPVQISRIPCLEYSQTIPNMSIGDTISFDGSALFAEDTEDIEERRFYFYDANGHKNYVKDLPIGKYQCKQEFYVVDNYKWKEGDAIRYEIAVFNRKTILLDSIRKYNAGYSRFFLLKKGRISEDYQYTGEGDFIGSADYSKSITALYEWRICIKEKEDMYDGEIGDSILVGSNNKFYNLNDVQITDSLLKDFLLNEM